jgi:hypothetical protein
MNGPIEAGIPQTCVLKCGKMGEEPGKGRQWVSLPLKVWKQRERNRFCFSTNISFCPLHLASGHEHRDGKNILCNEIILSTHLTHSMQGNCDLILLTVIWVWRPILCGKWENRGKQFFQEPVPFPGTCSSGWSPAAPTHSWLQARRAGLQLVSAGSCPCSRIKEMWFPEQPLQS